MPSSRRPGSRSSALPLGIARYRGRTRRIVGLWSAAGGGTGAKQPGEWSASCRMEVSLGEREQLLAGAGKGRQVWRVGGTVRRETGPWTPAVHALLRYLEVVGFDGAPRVLGIDERGREVLTFIDGQEGRHVRHDAPTLTAVGQLIRRFHDAVEGFQPPRDSLWRSAIPGEACDGSPIICHNDLAPYNTIYRAGSPVAFIDWDLAAPAPAIRDVAHAAWAFVPLYTDEDCAHIGLPIRPRGPRLRRFCDGYGLQERDRFLDVVRAHLLTLDSKAARRSVPYLDTARRDWESHLM